MGRLISGSVNRAFMAIGILFIFGGAYLAALLIFTAPEEIVVPASITSVRTEKVAPFHEGDEPRTQYIAYVVYTFDEVEYQEELYQWEDVGWTIGSTVSVYLDGDEPQYPSPLPLGGPEQNIKNAKIAGPAMGGMGLLLFLVGLFSTRGDRKRMAVRVKDIEKRLKSLAPQEYPPMGTISEYVSRGNRLLGGILMGLGLIVFLIMTIQIFSPGEMFERLISIFPLAISLILLFLGSFEFHTQSVAFKNGQVTVIDRRLGRRRERKVSSLDFVALVENKIVKTSGSKRTYLTEAVLLHLDPSLNEIAIGLFPREKGISPEIEALGRKLALPVIKD